MTPADLRFDQFITWLAAIVVCVFAGLELLLWLQWRIRRKGPRWDLPAGYLGMATILVTFALTTWPVTR